MATLAMAASAKLTPFERGTKYWANVFPRSLRSYATNLSSRTGFRSSWFCTITSGIAGRYVAIIKASKDEATLSKYTWPDNKRPRVCILGGGFGGLYTALRLESLVWTNDKKPQVLLVDQSERFVFKPLLYELLSGEVDAWEIAPRFSDLLASTSIQFFQDRVKLLNPSDYLGNNGPTGSGGTVHLESGILIEYDWLVLALGAEAKLDIVPGAAEFALPFSTLEDARKVDMKLRMLERDKFGKDSSPICVAVVGCGYSGVELAATVSERLQDKGIVQAINIETTICPAAPPGNREAALKVLSSRSVQLFLGYFVRCLRKVCSSVDSDNLNKIEGGNGSAAEKNHEKLILELQPAERGLQVEILEADLVLWTVGSKPLVPSLEPGKQVFPVNGRGQAETDETLRVKGHPRIFAIGDSTALRDSSGRLLPATAQVAFQQADFAGWNLWAAINDRPLLPFRYQNLGEMMTLGKNDAAISPSFIEGLTLDGPIGHTARKIAYLLRMPTDEHRVKVGISWLTKSTIDSIASLQNTVNKRDELAARGSAAGFDPSSVVSSSREDPAMVQLRAGLDHWRRLAEDFQMREATIASLRLESQAVPDSAPEAPPQESTPIPTQLSSFAVLTASLVNPVTTATVERLFRKRADLVRQLEESRPWIKISAENSNFRPRRLGFGLPKRKTIKNRPNPGNFKLPAEISIIGR